MRDLDLGRKTDVVAGHDGGIWLLRDGEFLRLGGDVVHEWRSGRQDLPWDDGGGTPPWHDFEVTPDGTVWTAMEMHAGLEDPPEETDLYIWSFDGDEWEPRLPTYLLGGPVALTSDGTVWAV